MFFPCGRIIARGLQDQRYDKLWGKAKMETGVNPVRSRHCKGGVSSKVPLEFSGKAEEMMSPKSGDLHEMNFRIRR